MGKLTGALFVAMTFAAPTFAQQSVKVTQLPSATAPLNGSELLYLIQNGISSKAGLELMTMTLNGVSCALGQSCNISGAGGTFTAPGTGGALQSVQAKLQQSLNVLDYGAKCDNSTNDTTAVQNAINYIVSIGGGDLVLPTGACRIPSGVTIDVSATSGGLKPVVNITGQGPASSQLVCNGLNGPCLNVIGSSVNSVALITLSDFAVFGNGASGSIGLQSNFTAFMHLVNLDVEGFVTGWSASNLEQSSIEHSNFRFNTNGVMLNGAVGSGNLTGANSLTFYDVAISNNTATGLTVKNFAAVAYITGSIQYDGGTGVGGNYGALFEDTAGGPTFCGYNTITFFNAAFEGNGGDYDLGLNTQFCPGATLTVQGDSFLRHVANYATNNIALLGTEPQQLKLSANTFIYDPTYTPSAGRPTIVSTNTSGLVYDDGTNYFQSATELSTFANTKFGGTGPRNWTPADASGASVPFTVNLAKASISAKSCTVEFNVTYGAQASGSSAAIGNLPCTSLTGFIASTIIVTDQTSGTNYAGYVGPNTNVLGLTSLASVSTPVTNATLSGHQISGTVYYVSQ